MQFSNIATTRLGIVEDTLYHCGLPTVSASYSSYALADITRNINNAYQEVATDIMKAAGSWQYDDNNATSAPITYITMGNASASYNIPATIFRIQGVEVKDSGGTWTKLAQIDYNDVTMPLDEYFSGSGTPTHYDLLGNTIKLYPTPVSGSVTLASGVAVMTDKNVTLFTTASTSATPGFAAPFHKILSYSAAIDFVQDKGAQDRLVAMKERLKQNMISFYSHRNVSRPARIKPRRRLNTYK